MKYIKILFPRARDNNLVIKENFNDKNIKSIRQEYSHILLQII